MTKILIVEDEYAARERLSAMELWRNGTYTLCGAARNGAEGLLLYHEMHPDIIITDIEMPVMDGLDFIAALREENAELPIIILSCYESFSYAQRAIKLGVQDYLIKDFLEPEVLRSALINAVGQTGTQIQEPEEKNRYRVDKTDDLFALFEERNTDIIGKLKQFFSGCNKFYLFLMQIDYYDQDKTDTGAVVHSIQRELQSEGSGIVTNMGSGLLAVLLAPEREEPASDIPARILDYVEYHCRVTLTAAVDHLFTDLSEIQAVFASTKDLLRYRIFLGHRRVLTPAHRENVTWMDPETTEHRLESVKQAMLKNDTAAFFKILEELFTVNASGMIQYNYIEYVHIRLLTLLLSYIDMHHISMTDTFPFDADALNTLHALDTVAEMFQWFKKKFSDAFAFTRNRGASAIHSQHIREIIAVIHAEYSGNLSLEILAEREGIHKVYLSRLFKKETGRTCYEYIQLVRIEKAKELLLTTSARIGDIARETGFKSYDQFAVVFKKLTGDSPGSFKKKYK